jgi:putative transcriptional regulator
MGVVDSGLHDERFRQAYKASGGAPGKSFARSAHRSLCVRAQSDCGAPELPGMLAAVLNTSLSTVRQWEIGDKHPSGPSLKLLDLLDRKGLDSLI